MTTHELELPGCAPTPLAHYLKALGVLRLVAEQIDAAATGRWDGERFVLRSLLDRDGLARFFLHEYRPTPIVAPWNGGSGFYPKDNHIGLDAIARSIASRLEEFREAISFSKAMVEIAQLAQSPKDDVKAAFLTQVRARAPEPMLLWFDAAILLSGDELRFPPLVGTGGNDGRLDFTNNFMQRLTEVAAMDADAPTPLGCAWLPAALSGEPVPGLASAAVGQFNPGGAGGPNAGTGFSADSLVNPWDFVLMLEGALLFAAAASRRLEHSEGASLSYPFTVRSSGLGAGGAALADEAQARGEMWLPLWERFAGLAEIRALFSEGRATLRRRPARDGLDFARAVASLGVDRGLTAFQRYGFLKRSGKAYLATPLNRIPVRRNPDSGLIEDLDGRGFLELLRRMARDENTSGRVRSLVRRLEDALFDLARAVEPRVLQTVLIHLGQLEGPLSLSRKARETVSPLPTLSEGWVVKADDHSSEFRIACALAGLTTDSMPMRLFTARVALNNHRWEWHPESRLAVWGDGPVVDNLCHVVDRRALEAARRALPDRPFFSTFGADIGDVVAFLVGATDEVRVGQLLQGLTLARIPSVLAGPARAEGLVPAAFAVLKPFFAPDATLRYLGLLPADARLPSKRDLAVLLASGRIDDAVALAWRRLKAAQFPIPGHPRIPPAAAGHDAKRLLAALSVPLHAGALGQTLRRIAEPATQAG